ncbi:MAG: DUF885 domain-containing protein [Pirellulales bacterium]
MKSILLPRIRSRTRIFALLSLLFFVHAFPTSVLAQEWDAFVDRYLNGYFELHPDEAVKAGRHEFDGRLPDWSPAGLRKTAEYLHRNREEAARFKHLNRGQEFERQYLTAEIDRELFVLEKAHGPQRNPLFYLGLGSGLDPSVYITRKYAPAEVRLRGYTGFAQQIPQAVENIKRNLRTPLPKTFVDVGRAVYGGMVGYLEKDVPAVFASVKNAQLQQEFATANAAAVAALRELTQWFESLRSTATDKFALGPELFQQMLADTERVTVPLADLERVGKSDLERNLKSLEEACAKYAPGKTISEAVELVRHRKPSGGPVAGARQQLAGLKKFLIDKDLVTIPSPEEALVEESPPYARWNFAYINIPGPYEKGLPATYYIAPPDPSWSPAEQEAYLPAEVDLLFVSAHEVWPGHFLQYLHSNRSRSKFGQIFVGYAFAEGWAHYTEELMWEAGLGAGDPETHIGQLMNALLRNVRFVSAIGLHNGTMTVEQSERMFREEAFVDPGNARQQAARGTFDPAYLNYTLGKLMIMKLRDDWTKTRGGRKSWKAFHDEFLSRGGPPVPLIRAAMLGPEDQGPLFAEP